MVARCRSRNGSNGGMRSEAHFYLQCAWGAFCRLSRTDEVWAAPARPGTALLLPDRRNRSMWCCCQSFGGVLPAVNRYAMPLVWYSSHKHKELAYVIDLVVVFGASSTTVHCQLTTNKGMDIPDHSVRCPVESGRVCKVCRLSLELAGSHCMLCEIATRLRGAAAPSSTYPTIHRCTSSGPRNHTLRGTHSRAVPTCCRPRRPLCLS